MIHPRYAESEDATPAAGLLSAIGHPATAIAALLWAVLWRRSRRELDR